MFNFYICVIREGWNDMMVFPTSSMLCDFCGLTTSGQLCYIFQYPGFMSLAVVRWLKLYINIKCITENKTQQNKTEETQSKQSIGSGAEL